MKVVSRGATPQSGTCHSCLASPKIKALPEIKAGVIVADPEWCFEPDRARLGCIAPLRLTTTPATGTFAKAKARFLHNWQKCRDRDRPPAM
jgi:hypothetical protein